jgi:hypothetical protein
MQPAVRRRRKPDEGDRMLMVVVRTLFRRALAWDPSRSRHPYLSLLWPSIAAVVIFVAIVLLA